MPISFRQLAATVSAASLAAAALLAPALPAHAIVGGAPDAGEHPYVGQLLFYVPDAVDPRFEDPGAWFKCTGTLIDEDTVVTAGHCTYAVGVEGEAPADPLHGGTDVWFSVLPAPDYSILKPSSTYVPDRNAQRYTDWSKALDASSTWHEAEATFTHPEYVDAAFLLHDLGVVELSEPIVLQGDGTGPAYGTLPQEGYLDRYYTKSAKRTALFESVGYGLEDSGPKFSLGGDTRRKADRRLVSFKGAYGLPNIAVMFSHAGRGTTGGTCFGDSGGPTFDITTPQIAEQNIIVAVTSFGLNSNCNAGGSYRIDQPDDLEFLMDPSDPYTP
ncbi:trypsin-like serine protease [Nocardioides astragali]|uniref:Trypsin-like serine protease n=1 Tax=Nocardioides astragali TaxID=1776736 RepID=A0ABW2NA45_9ACTN|nr:trypsin-like serine protease [Nocardioides astragali]